MKKIFSIFFVLLFLISNLTTVSLAKPTFNSLVKNYEKTASQMLKYSYLSDAMSKTGTIQDIALDAYQDYQKYSGVSLGNNYMEDYSLNDFISDAEYYAKIGFQQIPGKYTLAAKAAVKAKHIEKSREMTKLEKEMKNLYPKEADTYFNKSNPGSGGGGASRPF